MKCSTVPEPDVNAALIEVMLDETPYTKKPEKDDWKRISNALANGFRALSLEELIRHVESGHTFSPGVFRDGRRSNETWVQQQLFCLDFDHGLRMEAFSEMCRQKGVHPVFVYPTFSHTEAEHRFRAVFLNEFPVTDLRLRNLIQGILIRTFTVPESRGKAAADMACGDPARLFCGTNRPVADRDLSARVNPIGLLEGHCKWIKAVDSPHFAERWRKLCGDFGIETRASEFGVNHVDYLTFRESTVSTIEHIDPTVISRNETPIVFKEMLYAIQWMEPKKENLLEDEKGILNQSTTPDSARARHRHGLTHSPKRLSSSDREALLANCRLVREFMAGTAHIDHHGRRILVTNLLQREGGIAWYRQGKGSRSDYGPDTLVEDAKRYRMRPEGCSHCPYSGECDHATNLLQKIPTKRRECRQIREAPPRESIEQTRDKLRQALLKCMDSKGSKIFVIKCDTGVGKTQELLKLDLDGVCVAFDTHRLKEEAYQRLSSKDDGVFLWPDSPALPPSLKNKAERFRAAGRGGVSSLYRRALGMKCVTRDLAWKHEIERYLEATARVHRVSSVFATHEKAYQLQHNSGIHTIIFDEDFTRTLVRVEEVSPEDLKTVSGLLRKSGKPALAGMAEHVECILALPENTTIVQHPVKYSQRVLRKIMAKAHPPVSSPVEAVFTGAALRIERPGKGGRAEIHCITRHELRKDRKYIMLSATADETVCRRLFGDRLEFIDLSGTRLQGKLAWHAARSYSKTRVTEDPAAFASQVCSDQSVYGFEGIITHKCCAEDGNPGTFLKQSRKAVPVLGTFGGLQGLDSLGGRNIAVYGTPYPPERAIRLWAALLGLGTGENDFSFLERVVEWDEYELSLATCSTDPDIQRLYLWLAHSEIVQAVGRARLVSNHCTVHLFSKLPVSGGALVA